MTVYPGLPKTVLAYACCCGMIIVSFPLKSIPVGTTDFTVILGRKSVLGTVRAVPWLWGRCEAVWCGWLASKTEVSMPNSEPGLCPTDTGEALRPLFLTPEILSM